MVLHPRQLLALTTAAAVLGSVGLGQRLLSRAESHIEPSESLAHGSVSPAKLEKEPDASSDPKRGDVRIVVISDLNSAYGSTSYEPEVGLAIALIPDWNPDLVLAGGDMVAGQKKELSNAQVQAMWNAFDEVVRQPLDAAGIPFGFTIGNHDGSGAKRQGEFWFARDRALASSYWNDVNPDLPFVDRAQFPFYYSFLQDEVFYLVWDASTAELGEQQLAWAEGQLASEVAQGAKARLVIGHLPLYPVAVRRDRPGEFLNNADQLRQLLEDYDVHTYISGHNHAYYPGEMGELDLLHAGALGGGPRQLLGSEAEPFKALTVVDLFFEDGASSGDKAQKVYQTYRLPEMTLVDAGTLPEKIVSDYGTVQRQIQQPEP